MLKGLDISSYQTVSSFHEVVAAGYSFCFAKAAEGVSWVDPKFNDHWKRMKEVGLTRGAYLYFRPGEDPVAQAKHLCATVSLEPGDLPLVIDVEKPGLSPGPYGTVLQACLKAVERISGLTPLLYCSPGWFAGQVAGDFSRWPVWVAHYTHADHPNLPHGWNRWTFWQWSSSGTVPGISGNCDLDRFNGSEQGLLALCKK